MKSIRHLILSLCVVGSVPTPARADNEIELIIDATRAITQLAVGTVTYVQSFNDEPDHIVRDRAEESMASAVATPAAASVIFGGAISGIGSGAYWAITGRTPDSKAVAMMAKLTGVLAVSTGVFGMVNKAFWNRQYSKRGLSKLSAGEDSSTQGQPIAIRPAA